MNTHPASWGADPAAWAETCGWCGEPLHVDLVEVWPDDRAWMLDTCCEGLHEELVEAIAEHPQLLRPLFGSYGIPTRRIYAEDGWLRIDFGLELGPVNLTEARAFVGLHHRHNGPPVGWRWGHGVYNGRELVGVATVGRPVARMLNDGETVEVNRVCIDPGLAPELTEHAASKLYGAAAREAKRRGFARILTYTLETERGTSLRAAGWIPTHRTRAESWDRRSRRRTDKAPTCRKVRWERTLRAGPQLTLDLEAA